MKKKFLYLSIFSLFLIMGCDEEKQIKEWISKVNGSRQQVSQELNNIPYKKAQYQIFKEYFSEVNKINSTLEEENKFIEPFNEVVSKNNLFELCAKLFLPKDEWQLLMNRCQKNRFFLGPEEARAYPEIISALRNYLSSENQKRFDETQTCQIR